MTEQKRSNLPWILAGCGVVLLFGCCLSTAAGVLFYRAKVASQQAAEESYRRMADLEEQRRLAEERLGGNDGPALPDFAPGTTPSITVMATVTHASGNRLTVRAGEPCMFQIEYPERSDQPGVRWCHTVARCGGVRLYGGTTNGFFPCTFSLSPPAVRGTDPQTTGEDRDGAFTIDTAAGTLQIRDDSAGDYGTFSVDATITRTM